MATKIGGFFSGVDYFSEALPSVVTFTGANPTTCPMHLRGAPRTRVPGKLESQSSSNQQP